MYTRHELGKGPKSFIGGKHKKKKLEHVVLRDRTNVVERNDGSTWDRAICFQNNFATGQRKGTAHNGRGKIEYQYFGVLPLKRKGERFSFQGGTIREEENKSIFMLSKSGRNLPRKGGLYRRTSKERAEGLTASNNFLAMGLRPTYIPYRFRDSNGRVFT